VKAAEGTLVEAFWVHHKEDRHRFGLGAHSWNALQAVAGMQLVAQVKHPLGGLAGLSLFSAL